MSAKPRSEHPRGAGGWLAPSDIHRMGSAIRAALDAEPALTLAQLQERTGAKQNFAQRVRARWRQLRGVAP